MTCGSARSARSSSSVCVSGGMLGSPYICASLTNAARRTVSSSPASASVTVRICTSGSLMAPSSHHRSPPRCTARAGPPRLPWGLVSSTVPAGPTTPTAPSTGTPWVLTLSCPDRPGIVHAVAGLLAEHGGNITESQQFGDPLTGLFFMRVQVTSAASRTDLERALAELAAQFSMTWTLDVAGRPIRTLILGSTAAHCLNDLAFRQRSENLPIEIVAVVSNHTVLADLARFYDIPFHHIPVTAATKAAAEAQLLALVEELDVELLDEREQLGLGSGLGRGGDGDVVERDVIEPGQVSEHRVVGHDCHDLDRQVLGSLAEREVVEAVRGGRPEDQRADRTSRDVERPGHRELRSQLGEGPLEVRA